jgi:predicted kinase
MSTIILFRGLPAVGKTFISDETGKILKTAIIRKDDIADSIHSDISSQEIRNKICHKVIFNMIETNLAADTDLIIDCPFKNIDELKNLSAFIRERKGQLKTILCNCTDENLWEERFNERKANANDDGLLLDFKDLRKSYPNLVLEKFGDELVVDTSISLDENILGILNYVR